MRLLILGGSGIGMIAASIASLSGVEVVGFLNDFEPVNSHIGRYQRYPVIGRSEDVHRQLRDADVGVFVAYLDMGRERKSYNKLLELDIPSDRFLSLVHPSAVVPRGFCELGAGVLIGPLAQVSTDARIEDNCILLGGSFLGHDSTMRRYSRLATNAVVGGTVDVGRGAHVGSNAVVRERVRLGDFSLVGSGAVVLEDVPEGRVVVGNPAAIQ